jgi:hypothetical protein
MRVAGKFQDWVRVPRLTGRLKALALTLAAAADGLQLALTGPGWFGPDQIIDCVAMVLISRVIGFHVLLLPTFVVELVPLLEDLPTWTACTAAVIVLRQREQDHPASPQPGPPPPGIIPPRKSDIDI